MQTTDVPETHDLVITNFKASLGFVANCSCGKRINRVTACNGPGRRYFLYATDRLFEEHLQEASNADDQT